MSGCTDGAAGGLGGSGAACEPAEPACGDVPELCYQPPSPDELQQQEQERDHFYDTQEGVPPVAAPRRRSSVRLRSAAWQGYRA